MEFQIPINRPKRSIRTYTDLAITWIAPSADFDSRACSSTLTIDSCFSHKANHLRTVILAGLPTSNATLRRLNIEYQVGGSLLNTLSSIGSPH